MKDHLREPIKFVMRTEQHIGEGIAKTLPEQLKAAGWNRIGLVVDGGLREHNTYLNEIVELLETSLDLVEVFSNDMAEPSYDYLDEAKLSFESVELDCFVGIGGGSTLDLTKGLATLKTNPGDAVSYRGFGKVVHQPLPVVALPSTAGTGSEVTPYAVFTDLDAQWKFGINSEHNFPRLAFYDPHFLESCTLKIFASAGLDAMTHTLESFAARDATCLSRIHSVQAFKMLWDSLWALANGDRSIETKLSLLAGSGCAGIALMNSGAGPSGALSYPLGVYFKVPHGIAGSIFLPSVIQFNIENGYLDYAELYALVEEHPGDSPTEQSLRFSDELRKLCQALEIPIRLEELGVKRMEDRQLIVDNAYQLKAAFDQNPVPFGPREIKNLIFSL